MNRDGLPQGWNWVSLKESGTWYGGGTPSKRIPAFWDGGSNPWLSPKDMGKPTLSGTRDHVTDSAVSSSSTKLVPPGSVAFVVRSGILERTLPIAMVPFATTMNQDMKAIVPRSGISASWLRYALMAMEPDLLRRCRKDGTTVASIDTARLMNWQIPLPPPAEQFRIVEVLEAHLSRLDAAAESLTEAARRADTLVDRQIIATLTATAAPSVALRQILASKPSNGRSVPTALNGSPVLRLTALRGGSIDLAERKFGDWTGHDPAKYQVKKGDILLSRGNGSRSLVGRAGVVQEQPDTVAFPDTMIRLTPDPATLDSDFLVTIWNSPLVRGQIEKQARTTAGIYKINQAMVSSFEIPLPPLCEQIRIMQSLTDLRAVVGRARAALHTTKARADSLRRSLLRAAVAGELADQDPADEPTAETIVGSRSR